MFTFKKNKEQKEIKSKNKIKNDNKETKIDGFNIAKKIIASILLLALASGTLVGIYEMIMFLF